MRLPREDGPPWILHNHTGTIFYEEKGLYKIRFGIRISPNLDLDTTGNKTDFPLRIRAYNIYFCHIFTFIASCMKDPTQTNKKEAMHDLLLAYKSKDVVL